MTIAVEQDQFGPGLEPQDIDHVANCDFVQFDRGRLGQGDVLVDTRNTHERSGILRGQIDTLGHDPGQVPDLFRGNDIGRHQIRDITQRA